MEAYIFMAVGILAFPLSLWMEVRLLKHEQKHGIDPRHIATVCMQCGKHISGPRIGIAIHISHGICTRCAEQWKRELITHQEAIAR